MTTQERIKGFFSFALIQGKTKIISNLNINGYPTALNISNQDLVDKLYSIFLQKGESEVSKLLEGVSLTNISQTDLLAIRASLTGQTPEQLATQKTLLQTLQELWGGVSTSTGDSSSTTVASAIPVAITLVVVLTISGLITWLAFKS